MSSPPGITQKSLTEISFGSLIPHNPSSLSPNQFDCLLLSVSPAPTLTSTSPGPQSFFS